MSKDVKRDKNGRFVKKARKPIDVSIEVEKDKNCSGELTCVTKEEWEQLNEEHDAFKMVAESFMSKYLNERRDKKLMERELESYKHAYKKMKSIAVAWRDVAAHEQDKHLYAKDALRTACMHIGWLRNRLTKLQNWKYKDILRDMDVELDRMMMRIEGLDKE